MAVLSRYESRQFSCYELAHPWTTSCARSWLDVSASGLLVSLQVYTPLFLLARLLGRSRAGRRPRHWPALLGSVARDSLQSSLFLATNCYFFVCSFCVVRWLVPALSQQLSILAAGVSASFLAILLERRSRRSALTVYMLNIASEAAAHWLLARGRVPRLPGLRRALAVVAFAALLALHRAGRCDGVLESIARALLGTCEVMTASGDDCQSSCAQPTAGGRLLAVILALVGVHRRVSSAGDGGRVCRHPGSCLSYAGTGLMESVALGVAVRVALSTSSAAVATARRLVSVLSRRSRRSLLGSGRGVRLVSLSSVCRALGGQLRLGLCLGLLTSLFRAVSCLLRRWRGVDSAWHALPAGGVAAVFGLSVFSSSSIELYLFWKVVDACCRLAARVVRQRLSAKPTNEECRSAAPTNEECRSAAPTNEEWCEGSGGAAAPPSTLDTIVSVLLYSAATGVMLAIGALEPQHIRTSYWRFLQRLTDGHISRLNRPLMLLCCGTDSMALEELRRVTIRIEPKLVAPANRVHLRRLGQL